MAKKYLSLLDEHKIKLIKSEGDTFDKIKGHLAYGSDYIRLTTKQEQQLERWTDIFSMLKKGRSPEFISGYLKRTYGIEGISSVYRDIKASERLFAEVDDINKNVKRLIAMEWARMSFKMAMRKRDVTGMNAATKNLIAAAGLDKEDPETFREEDLQHHSYFAIFNINDESFKIDLKGSGLEKMSKNRASSILNSLYTDIEDVEAIEIMEDGEQANNV